jgi:hypothetical protein
MEVPMQHNGQRLVLILGLNEGQASNNSYMAPKPPGNAAMALAK